MNIEPTNWWKTKIVMFLARHTPKCHDITRLISAAQDNPLPWGTRVKMRLHFWICAWCARYRDQLGFMRKAMRVMPEESAPGASGLSAESKERLKRAFQEPG